VSILSRELIACVLLAMAAWTLPACNAAGLILKSPLNDKCNEAGLKKCPDLTDAVIAYAGGEKEDSKKKIAAVVAANEPQRTQQFAEALETIANLPGLGATADTIRELADFLKGDKPEKTGGASASAGKLAAVVGETLLPTGPAAAPSALAPDHAKIEPQARALQKKAMDDDYLTVAFDKAADKLNQAITKCGTNHCAANLRALLRRDLAVVYSAASKQDLSLAAMVDALKIDGTIQLDPNFKTKEVEAIYAQARKGGGGGSAVAAVSSGGGSPSGDFTHNAPVEEAIRTPLPIYVEYGGSEALAKVVVKYKAFGMPDFKTFELKKLGDGWGGTLPCTDMLEGDIQYYLQGFNATNDPVATGGDRNNTYRVSIKKAIASEPPHLPGQIAPMQCAEGADCPPDFPGCKKAGADTLLAGGADCAEDGQCKSKDEKCTAPPADEGSGVRPPLHRIWVGVGASLDLDILSGVSNVCKLDPTTAQPLNAGYYCTAGGSDFPPRTKAGQAINNQIVTGGPSPGDALSGGPNIGSLRILGSFDYAINYNLMVGARFGYGFLSYTGSAAGFPPIYLEGRLTWVIGKDAIAKSGFAPVLFLGGGAGQFSSSVSIPASLCQGTATATTTGTCTSGKAQGGEVNAWRVGGPVFVGPGGGVRFAFTPQAAAFLNVKLALAFGGGGILIAPGPELGVQFGF
jgi:hypothetical protein